MTFKGYDYKDYIKMFGYFRKFPAMNDHTPKWRNVYLRHDIDGKPENSLRMAEIEAILGIESTYFVLNYSPYWGDRDLFKTLRMIQEMGHEIGWHQCVIVQAHVSRRDDLRPLITEPLKRLRDEGLTIRGTSPHGSAYGAANNINSWQLWAEYRNPYKDMPTFTLAEFGLEYEAMHLHRDDYHSDSCGKWCGDPVEMAYRLHSKTNYILQVNIHPQHWT